MATTYQSSRVAGGVPARAGINQSYVLEVYEVATALVIDDVIEMITVPAGAVVCDVILSVDDLDTGATLVLSVGDGAVIGRYILADTIGQGGGTVRLGAGITGAAAASPLSFTYAAEDTIDIYVDAAPTGGGVGTVALAVAYTLDP